MPTMTTASDTATLTDLRRQLDAVLDEQQGELKPTAVLYTRKEAERVKEYGTPGGRRRSAKPRRRPQ